MGKNHHEPFKTLSGIEWGTVVSNDLANFLDKTFADAFTIVDSIPRPPPSPTAAVSSTSLPSSPGPSTGKPLSCGRARSHTDSALRDTDLGGVRSAAASASLPPRLTAESIARAQELRKEWREVKVATAGTADNPLGVNVYKLGAKDGRGSWFARRSVHVDLSFDRWRLGLEHEFAETMKVQTGPGGGNIRGIGAERVVERHVVDSVGRAEVFQLSAQFPGPTAPRDFITLLLSSDNQSPSKSSHSLREFIIVSKPCVHPECPPRRGYIRGQYESVELIREVHITAPPEPKRTRSSVDMVREHERPDRKSDTDLMLRPGEPSERSLPGNSLQEEKSAVAVEWIMVTRSDPGGSVPRFMIERGTPGAIVTDAGKFAKWLTSKVAQEEKKGGVRRGSRAASASLTRTHSAPQTAKSVPILPCAVPEEKGDGAHTGGEIGDEEALSDASSELSQHVPSSNGLYGMVALAIGAAGSAVTSRLSNPFGGTYMRSLSWSTPDHGDNTKLGGLDSVHNEHKERDDHSDHSDYSDNSDGTLSDTSSALSFTSALESSVLEPTSPPGLVSRQTDSSSAGPHAEPIHGNGNGNVDGYVGAPPAAGLKPAQGDRELRKLEERRIKLDERIRQQQERMAKKGSDDRDKDAAAIARLREKHERDLAKHEDKYRREVRRLEKKREAERRKAEARWRKVSEREERNRLGLQLDRVTAERDLARRQAEMLREQVGQLQRENTMLVAELGRAGLRPKPLVSSYPPPRGSVAVTDDRTVNERAGGR